MGDEKMGHPSNSEEQCIAERAILAALEQALGVTLDDSAPIQLPVVLDGFHLGPPPVCVEVFARQGRAKPGQQRKLMADMCKLLLVEKLLGQRCRTIVAVCDPEALRGVEGSWRAAFADQYEIERIFVEVSDETRRRLLEAQRVQFR